MQFKIRYDDKILCLGNLHRLTIEVGGKAWCYDDNRSRDNSLTFKVVELGYAGIGNWLKQWRKRGRYKPEKEPAAGSQKDGKKQQRQKLHRLTQAKAAEIFGVSQPFIANVENERKPMPAWMFWSLHKDILKHRRFNMPPVALRQKLPRRDNRKIED